MEKLTIKEETKILELLEEKLIELFECEILTFKGENKEQTNNYRNELIKEHYILLLKIREMFNFKGSIFPESRKKGQKIKEYEDIAKQLIENN